MTRTFESRTAARERTPLLVGLIGPSGTGKTFSALRLATGIQRVSPGPIYVIDTEAKRALHYADKFKFEHVPFGAPFSSLDYLDAINYAVGKGAATIVVDSMSHEHEGPGGLLEWHAAEHAKMGGSVKTSMLAWQKPKQARRRLINTLLQLPCNFIFCFRAKEKIKIVKGEDPVPLGFMPIAGEEFVYEMTIKCLLLPGANGIPTWSSTEVGERMMIKLAEQFRPTFANGPQLTEDIGQQLATWAAGIGAPVNFTPAEFVQRYRACFDPVSFRELEEARQRAWSSMSKADKAALKQLSDEAKTRLEAAAAPPPVAPAPPSDDEDLPIPPEPEMAAAGGMT